MAKLFVCATPIGNLEDVSIRLLKTLREVDLIACEDTRHTLKLLNHYKIKKPLTSYHLYTSKGKEIHIIDQIRAGKNIALVSDAGMPAISDPGEYLVRRAIEAGIEVEVIPGPSAFIAALAVSGLDTSSFIFAGFLPAKRGKRREIIGNLATEMRTIVFYEAPHRLLPTLEDMIELMEPERPAVVVRELTKVHQEIKRGSLIELEEYYTNHIPRGEITLLVGGRPATSGEVSLEAIIEETQQLIAAGIEKKQAFKMKAREHNIPKSTIYKYFIEHDL
ncbi:16S rRNA (cytidine(1402)-2'-O)-methyltransferase [Syntrophomonas erecta]